MILEKVNQEDYGNFLFYFFESNLFQKSPENMIKIYETLSKKITGENGDFTNNVWIRKEQKDRGMFPGGPPKRYSTIYKEVQEINGRTKMEGFSLYEVEQFTIDFYLNNFVDEKHVTEIGKQLIQASKIPYVFEVVERLKGKDKNLDQEISQLLNENPKAYAKWIIDRKVLGKYTDWNEKSDKLKKKIEIR